ncbi:MAG: hypothetical protein QF722_06925, partial [Candidatus Thalassarchaeaceae archaeon]|nr:hypothetical protein [Candidatus Thalassarchaeaceae archaeon]
VGRTLGVCAVAPSPLTGAVFADSAVRRPTLAGVFAPPRAVLTRFTGVSSTIVGLARSLFPDRPPSFSLFAYDSSRAFAFAFAFAFASSARVVVVSCAETDAYASNRTRNRASVVCAETRDGDDARVSFVVSLVARHVVVVAIIIIIIIIIFPNDPSHVRLPMPTTDGRPTDENDRRTVARAPRASRAVVLSRRPSVVLGVGRRT